MTLLYKNIYHKKFGIGRVQSIDGKYMIVNFPIGTKTFTYPSSIGVFLFEIFDNEFAYREDELIRYVGKEKNVKIPNFIRSIGREAFSGTGVESVSLENKVSLIDSKAFYKCFSLKSIKNTNRLSKIKQSAFRNCNNLIEIELPDTLRILEESVFLGCESLEKIKIPEKIKRINHSTFEDCIRLRKIDALDNVEVIDYDAFRNCISLETVNIGDSVKKIGHNAFYNCDKLKYIFLPDSIKTIYYDSFMEDVLIECNFNTEVENVLKKTGIGYKAVGTKIENSIENNTVYEEPIIEVKEVFTVQNEAKVLEAKELLVKDDKNNPIAGKINELFKSENKTKKIRKQLKPWQYATLAIIAFIFSITSNYERVGNIIELQKYGYIVTDEGTYVGESDLGIINGKGKIEYFNGTSYDGYWQNGVPSGNGVFTISDKTSLVGIFNDGDFVEGDIVTREYGNEVKYQVENGSIISYKYLTDDSIQVSFSNETGKFSLLFDNGDSFVGELNNKQYGINGQYKWANGKVYEGTFNNGVIEGDGTFYISENEFYKGTFKNNSWVNGSISIRESLYVYDIKLVDGSNVEYKVANISGDQYAGTRYTENSFGKGIIRYQNGNFYDGEIKNGLKEGKGTYYWSGAKYDGYWKNDQMNGKGTYYFGDKERLTGTFVNNKPDGTCYYYDVDGVRYITVWKNGEQISIKKG